MRRQHTIKAALQARTGYQPFFHFFWLNIRCIKHRWDSGAIDYLLKHRWDSGAVDYLLKNRWDSGAIDYLLKHRWDSGAIDYLPFRRQVVLALSQSFRHRVLLQLRAHPPFDPKTNKPFIMEICIIGYIYIIYIHVYTYI